MSEIEKAKTLSSGQSRRTIVKGAAWSVPVIAAAIATPLAAATGAPTGRLTVATIDCRALGITNNPGFTLTAVGGDTAATTFTIESSVLVTASFRNAWTTSTGLNVVLLGNNTWQFDVPAMTAGQSISFKSNTQLLNLLATFTGKALSSGSSATMTISNLGLIKACIIG